MEPLSLISLHFTYLERVSSFGLISDEPAGEVDCGSSEEEEKRSSTSDPENGWLAVFLLVRVHIYIVMFVSSSMSLIDEFRSGFRSASDILLQTGRGFSCMTYHDISMILPQFTRCGILE